MTDPNRLYPEKRILFTVLLIFIILASSMGSFFLHKTHMMISQSVFHRLESVREIQKSAVRDYFKERQKDMQMMIKTISGLKAASLDNLVSIRKSKKAQLENYFSHCFSAMNDIHYNLRVKNGLEAFSNAFRQGIHSSTYVQIYNQYYPGFKSLIESLGFYDIFLIDPSGNIIFTEKRESDLGQNLNSNLLKETGLAKIFIKGRTSTSFVDFSWYSPSKSPAAFMATPFRDKTGRLTGVVAFQLSCEKINKIMKDRVGADETNEAYLVGPDYLMRSDSLLDPVNRSVNASFQFPEAGKVHTFASKQGLAGHTGKDIIIDYRGQPVLSTWTSIKIKDVTWAVLVETDVTDVFSPSKEPENYFFNKHKEIYDYYDLFLINPDGYCFYTVVKEDDYQTNLVSGKYKDSSLGKLIQKVIKTKQFCLMDFQPYPPSQNALAAFIAQPLLNHGKIELIVAAQLAPDGLNNTLKHGQGMGETGETCLVGPDKRIRSNSISRPEKHSLSASFHENTEAVRRALSGETGKNIMIDYNNNKVFSVYAPLTIGDLTWAAITKINAAKAYTELNAIKRLTVIFLAIIIIACLILAFLALENRENLKNEPRK